MINYLDAVMIEKSKLGKDNSYQAQEIAVKAFDREHGRARLYHMLAKLFRKSNSLPVLSGHAQAPRHKLGINMISLDKIIGSVSREKDFDADFRPLKKHNRERWIRIAVAFLKRIPLPEIEVVQAGDQYYVRDGHHRVSVAKAMGQLDIEARVVN